MSEYNMTHTGKELDDAIAKVQSGYVFPNQAATVTKNGIYDTIGEIPVKLIDEIEVAVPVPDGYIIPSGTKNIVSNGTHNVKQYANAVVDVKHFASGNISLTAGKDPIAVTGITDQNGETFTPKGFCFALRPTGGASMNYAKGTSNSYCLVACIHTGEEATRIIAWHQNSSGAEASYSVKANPSTGNYSMSSGKFSIQVDNEYYRPIAGNYLWTAWG